MNIFIAHVNAMKDFHNFPIFKKAEQIFQLTEALCTTIPDDNHMLEATKTFMLENAIIIVTKIAGAEGGDLYDLRMENAALIRKAARELFVEAGSLLDPDSDNDYPLLLRDEINEFRLLFIEWVRGFDKWNYINDRWGLFNPPGIDPE